MTDDTPTRSDSAPDEAALTRNLGPEATKLLGEALAAFGENPSARRTRLAGRWLAAQLAEARTDAQRRMRFLSDAQAEAQRMRHAKDAALATAEAIQSHCVDGGTCLLCSGVDSHEQNCVLFSDDPGRELRERLAQLEEENRRLRERR